MRGWARLRQSLWITKPEASASRAGVPSVQPLSLAPLDSSPSRGASGEEEKPSGLPKPPLLGEVASRRDDGEVGQRSSFL